MKDFLETTVGKIILGVVVAVIWGVNVFNFSEMTGNSSTQSVQQVQDINMDELTIPEKISYSYSSTARDPFRRGSISTPIEETASQPEAEPVNYVDPGLVLAGIFDGMAVISDNFGQSYFLENGETFKDGILVKKIVQDSVVLEYKQRNLILKLN